MSDDLVYRMTSEAQNNQMIDQYYLEAGAILVEGADEISRLRSRVDELERELAESKAERARYGDTMTSKLGAAERKVNRLRDHLLSIGESPDSDDDNPTGVGSFDGGFFYKKER